MRLSTSKQISVKALIIYMISALLFLSSIELHIHTNDTAVTADHGYAVSITSFSNNFDVNGEIEVSPDGMLKIQHSAPNILALFLLLALIFTVFFQIYTARVRDIHQTSSLPFFGTPALRAPPQ